MLEEIRRSYLRDVVFLKLKMNEFLKQHEKAELIAEYDSMLPSLDLRQAFQPFAPEKTSFKVRPCETCGGHLELIINVSDELERLTKEIERWKKLDEQSRLQIATQNYQFERLQDDKNLMDRKHEQEVS